MIRLSEECGACGPGRPRQFDESAALAAGLQVFWTRGFEAATLEELTSAMRLSKSSFYACFGSKHGLLVAALNAYAAEAYDRLRSLAQGPVEEAVPAVLAALAMPDEGTRGCLLANCIAELAPSDAEVTGCVQRHLESIEGLLADLLTPRVGAVAADRARALLAMAVGMSILRKAGASEATIRAGLQEWRGLAFASGAAP